MDGDGDLDVLSASLGDDTIAWYENDGTPAIGGWVARDINTLADGAFSVHAADVDGDGDLDVLSASAFDDAIAWYENDGTPANGGWTARDISTLADGAFSVHAADVDGDGDLDVLSASRDDDAIAWYENDGTPANGGWIARDINTLADRAYSVHAADVDGDGDVDVLSASAGDDTIAWYENDGTPANGGWTARDISITADGAYSVHAADMDGDGDVDVLSASFNDDTIAWYENDGTPADGDWIARDISITADQAYSVHAADVDGDGDLDVLSASFGDDKIAWYENLPVDFGDAPAPYPTLSIENGASHQPGGPTLGNLRDAEGDGLHSALADADGADEDGVVFGLLRVGQLGATVTVNVQNALSGAKLDAWIDFDGDGNWGGPGEQIADNAPVANGDNIITFDVPSNAVDGLTFARFRLSTAGNLGVGGLAADGEVEDYAVTIAPPAAAAGNYGSQIVVPSATNGTWGVYAADLDGDGDMDLLSTSVFDDKVAWYENDGAESFTFYVIATSADGPRSVFAADVDGDGDLDVLSASYIDNTIAWYENDGTPAIGAWTARDIATTAEAAQSVYAADVDGDGDLDVLSASLSDDTIAWYENDGTPANGGWIARDISITRRRRTACMPRTWTATVTWMLRRRRLPTTRSPGTKTTARRPMAAGSVATSRPPPLEPEACMRRISTVTATWTS